MECNPYLTDHFKVEPGGPESRTWSVYARSTAALVAGPFERLSEAMDAAVEAEKKWKPPQAEDKG